MLVSSALPISINPLSCTPLFLRDSWVSDRLLRSTYKSSDKIELVRVRIGLSSEPSIIDR